MHDSRMSVTGEMVKAARTKLGESQAAFAERFGVYQTTVHRWETEGPPSRGAAGKALERVLGEIGVLEARA